MYSAVPERLRSNHKIKITWSIALTQVTLWNKSPLYTYNKNRIENKRFLLIIRGTEGQFAKKHQQALELFRITGFCVLDSLKSVHRSNDNRLSSAQFSRNFKPDFNVAFALIIVKLDPSELVWITRTKVCKAWQPIWWMSHSAFVMVDVSGDRTA